MSNFKQLGLSDTILEVLEIIGFETPTPIQEQAIPLLLQHNPTDFIGLAQTGTGKTAAFGLPLLDLIDTTAKHTQALIMAPTRELGQQIAVQLNEFAQNNNKLNIEVVYGGAPITRQIKALKGAVQIVVATPGRLLDLIRRKAIKLEQVSHVVLDEADEMLNMGFKEDIDAILEHTSGDRIIWLFSATMPSAIRKIIKKYMDDPHEVKVNTEEKANKDITHQYAVVKVANKVKAIRRLLDMNPDMKGVMFCRTKRDTEQIAEQLVSEGYAVAALNGDMSQGQRDRVMKQFKSKAMQMLIATDVAARGIDVKELSHVIHHSLPDQMEYYTHRSGRTGRAGNKGISLSLISTRQFRRIRDLERHLNVDFEQVLIPRYAEVLSKRFENWATKIKDTELHDQASEILSTISPEFEQLSKPDLIAKLISAQLHDMQLKEGDEDLNENASKKDKKSKDKKSKDNKYQGKGAQRYFINIGKVEGVNKADLVRFLSDLSGIDRKYIGNITLQKHCAYFDVDENKDTGFSKAFKGVYIGDRAVRVNKDDDANKPRRGRKGRSSSSGKGRNRNFKGEKSGRKAKSKYKYKG